MSVETPRQPADLWQVPEDPPGPASMDIYLLSESDSLGWFGVVPKKPYLKGTDTMGVDHGRIRAPRLGFPPVNEDGAAGTLAGEIHERFVS